MKYEAYHQVYSYTGYELDKLEEKNGTYYTESGENILDLEIGRASCRERV